MTGNATDAGEVGSDMSETKTYKLTASVTVSCYTTVEATSEEEAIELASGREVELEGRDYQESSWIVEEADGTPEDIKVSER